MKTSQFKEYSELPLFLNAEIIAKMLGISPASSYELMYESGFPVLKIGNRMVDPKEKFICWVEENTAGGTTSRRGIDRLLAGLCGTQSGTVSPCPTKYGIKNSDQLSSQFFLISVIIKAIIRRIKSLCR